MGFGLVIIGCVACAVILAAVSARRPDQRRCGGRGSSDPGLDDGAWLPGADAGTRTGTHHHGHHHGGGIFGGGHHGGGFSGGHGGGGGGHH
ncbi:hypothetical protein [Streptomyces sp. ICBB 8177]|uniref:hypothetical protein n=1 Tax=Streptomyces sp. ICBB 8177 TaxID=563922 RepID=UPI000D675463|nr:hypothetical protein [Streptomyces sp. ICBB 8177]PWI42504.1 hypothetical protein CK485_09145 [Streptomyces sp. ICBB 8177]